MGAQTNLASTTATPGCFGRFVDGLSRIVDPIAKIGGLVASTALGIMMFLTVLDVIGRFLGGWTWLHNITEFFKPIPGTSEITEFLMIILVSFGLGYMAFFKGHIRVDLILQYTSKRVSKWIDVYTYLFSFILYALVTWQAWFNGIDIFNNRITSAVLAIRSFPFAFLLLIGAAIVTLVLLRDFLKSIEEVGK
jgi:TRAP-type transport system small permease protein